MKPVPMLRAGGPDAPDDQKGDCLRACFCSLLEIEPDQLECFHGEDWWLRYVEALRPFGVYPLVVNVDGPLYGYWIAEVPSWNYPDCTHAIVMHEDTVVWDPSPGKKVTSVSYPQEGIVLVPDNPASGAVAA